jgi:hypothetical protein
MARADRFEIAPHREQHPANVVPLQRPVAVNPRHPSVRAEMFDQDLAAPDQFVKLSRVEAAHIATLLNVARGHLPSPRAVDEAIRLLGGKR